MPKTFFFFFTLIIKYKSQLINVHFGKCIYWVLTFVENQPNKATVVISWNKVILEFKKIDLNGMQEFCGLLQDLSLFIFQVI